MMKRRVCKKISSRIASYGWCCEDASHSSSSSGARLLPVGAPARTLWRELYSLALQYTTTTNHQHHHSEVSCDFSHHFSFPRLVPSLNTPPGTPPTLFPSPSCLPSALPARVWLLTASNISFPREATDPFLEYSYGRGSLFAQLCFFCGGLMIDRARPSLLFGRRSASAFDLSRTGFRQQ